MNLLVPVFLYFSVFVRAGGFLAPTVGVVLPDYPAEGKLEVGDRILAVDGEDVATFDEVRRAVEQRPGETVRLLVFRTDRQLEVELVPRETVRRAELELVERVGTAGIQATPLAPVIAVPDADSPAYRVGLRTFDVLTHVGGKPIRRYADLVAVLKENQGETIPVTWLRPVPIGEALGGFAAMAVYDAGVLALTPKPGVGSLLDRVGIELADPYVAAVEPGSQLAKAGLGRGDKLLTLDGQPVRAWSVLEERLAERPGLSRALTFRSALDGTVHEASVRLPDAQPGGLKQGTPTLLLGARSWLPLAPERRVEHPSPVLFAWQRAFEETGSVIRFLSVAVLRLAQAASSTSSPVPSRSMR